MSIILRVDGLLGIWLVRFMGGRSQNSALRMVIPVRLCQHLKRSALRHAMDVLLQALPPEQGPGRITRQLDGQVHFFISHIGRKHT